MAFSDPNEEAYRESLLGAQITQGFGPTNVSFEPEAYGFPHFHQGVDLVLPGGPAAIQRAPASGIVSHAGQYSTGHWPGVGYGNAVVIDAPNGYRYLIGHNRGLWTGLTRDGRIDESSRRLQEGDVVHFGDVIGVQGTTGASTGVHTHLEIRDPNGTPVDPAGAHAPNGRVTYADGLNSPKAVFGMIYHVFGGGGGYNPGHFETPPDPYHLSFAPEPNPLPNPSGSYSPIDEPYPAGQPTIPGGPGGVQPGTAQPVDWWNNPGDLGGNLLGQGFAGLIGAGPNLEKQIGPAIFFGILAGGLLLAGLVSLTRKAVDSPQGQAVITRAAEAA